LEYSVVFFFHCHVDLLALHSFPTRRSSDLRQNNLLKNSPHTARQIASEKWDYSYSREQAAFPAPWTHEHKFWPAVARIDNVYGDRNLFCSCPPVEEFES